MVAERLETSFFIDAIADAYAVRAGLKGDSGVAILCVCVCVCESVWYILIKCVCVRVCTNTHTHTHTHATDFREIVPFRAIERKRGHSALSSLAPAPERRHNPGTERQWYNLVSKRDLKETY